MALGEGGSSDGGAGAAAGVGGEGAAGAPGEQGAGGAAALLGGAAAAAAGAAGAGARGEQGEGQGVAAAEGGAPDWFAQVSAEADGDKPSLRDWLASTGVKDLDQLAKIARDNQAALRDSGRVKVPGEGASAEDIAAFHRSIGVPETIEGYGIEAPKGADGQPLPLNEGLVKLVSEAGLKFGVPKAALQGVLGEVFKADLDAMTEQARQQDAAAAQWLKDQGAAAADKTAAINRAAEALGLSAQDLGALRSAWGAEKALSVMAKLGEGLAEDKLLGGGDRQRFGIGGAEAQAEMDKLKTDTAFIAKAMQKGTPENVRWNRLQDAAAAHAQRQAEQYG